MRTLWDFCLLIIAHVVLEGEGSNIIVNLSTGKCYIYKLLTPTLQSVTGKKTSAVIVLAHCTLLISLRIDAWTQKFHMFYTSSHTILLPPVVLLHHALL